MLPLPLSDVIRNRNSVHLRKRGRPPSLWYVRKYKYASYSSSASGVRYVICNQHVGDSMFGYCLRHVRPMHGVPNRLLLLSYIPPLQSGPYYRGCLVGSMAGSEGEREVSSHNSFSDTTHSHGRGTNRELCPFSFPSLSFSSSFFPSLLCSPLPSPTPPMPPPPPPPLPTPLLPPFLLHLLTGPW